MPPDEPRDPVRDLKRNVNIALGLAGIMAFPVEVWTTRPGTWGSRYLASAVVLGLFWPLVFAACYGRHPLIGEVYGFWALTLGLLVVHQTAGVSRRSRGYVCHSRFRGYSWLTRRSDLPAQRQARYAENLLVFAFGVFLTSVGPAPLGTLLVISSVAKFVIDRIGFQAVEARLRQMSDARITNEFFAGQYRERHP